MSAGNPGWGLKSVLSCLVVAWLAGCSLPAAIQSVPGLKLLVPVPTRTPFQPLQVTPSLTASPATPTPLPPPELSIWSPGPLPQGLLEALAPPPGFAALQWVALPEQSQTRIEIGAAPAESLWIYALVAPFPTGVSTVSLTDLKAVWGGQPVGPFAGRPLLLEESTLTLFTAWWGAPAAGAVQVLAGDELIDFAWSHRPAWALVPFERLNPRWKVLEVDTLSPLHKDFDPLAYPLSVPLSLEFDPAYQQASWTSGWGLPATNRDPQQLTVLAMTGVTALVRATAYTMERQGIDYPARDVGDWLRAADITHISNEVPFASDCPFPNPVQADMRFCSSPDYIKLLETVGTDIVELTGDHFQDWGSQAMYVTLDLYRDRGWLTYGGGANLSEARQPALIEHHGNRLAFLGCNAKGGGFAQAGANQPGAGVCDFGWLQSEVARLRAEGFLPIVTFQHFEYYTYQAQPSQLRDFRAAARAGAVIVSGSQAHQPQALEFLDGALIHYGLGNLFFDQFDISLATRQGFIDRHIFYAGQHIATELLPIMFIDYARPRPMNLAEQDELLQAVFSASGW